MQPRFEPTFVEAFKENPVPFAGVVVLAGIGLVVGVVALVLALKRSNGAMVVGIMAAATGLAAVGVGAMGMMAMRAHVNAAVSAPGLSAPMRDRIVTYGYAESMYSLWFGAGVGLVPLVAGVGCAAMGRSRQAKKA